MFYQVFFEFWLILARDDGVARIFFVSSSPRKNKNSFFLMTCCANPHNMVDSNKHPATGASSPPMAIVKMTIEGGQFDPRGRSQPLLHPFPPQIPNCSYCVNHINGICTDDEAPAVGGPVLTMLWRMQSSQQVIITVILGSCHPIIS